MFIDGIDGPTEVTELTSVNDGGVDRCTTIICLASTSMLVHCGT